MKNHLSRWYPLYVGIVCGFAFDGLFQAFGAAICVFILVEMIKVISGHYDNKDIA